MATFTRVNADLQPVFALDVQNGPVSPSATFTGPVQPQGPKLDFFSATANANVAGVQGVNEYVNAVVTAIQQTSTIAMYQVDGTQFSFAVYPAGAFADGNAFLSTANVTYTGFQLDSVATTGFKLATS